jgi:cellulose synthase/poly-beta-1,6-N-acetylglucosamine synthase-like glycosyltransferase
MFEDDYNNLITIVVPCYNDGEFLLENLSSLEAQTYKNFEVVVVNDGSTDPKTLEVSWQLMNASITRIKYNRRGIMLAVFNDVTHLELAGDPALLTYR